MCKKGIIIKMKVLLINGGPHKNGATDCALRAVADALGAEGVDSEIYWLGNDPIAGCIGCMACKKSGKCFRDDVVNKIAERLEEFDGFIFGSPVHYAAASGALSSFMDRLFMSAGGKMYMKPAAAVVSCRRGGASAAFDEINKYFMMTSMPVVASQYWNQIHGSNAEEASRDYEGIQTMQTLAKNMAYLLKCMKSGERCGILPPEREPVIRTNFIR